MTRQKDMPCSWFKQQKLMYVFKAFQVKIQVYFYGN